MKTALLSLMLAAAHIEIEDMFGAGGEQDNFMGTTRASQGFHGTTLGCFNQQTSRPTPLLINVIQATKTNRFQ